MVTQLSQIIYPESDGQPMADNTKQFELIVYLKKGLDWLFANNSNVFIAGDLFWYPVEGQPSIVYAPDVMVVFGRPKGHRGSYKQWEEDNIPPQVVFEILSPNNTVKEMAKKLLFYNQYAVEEYYLYDPDTTELKGWLREEGGGLSTITQMNHWVSPRLGIEFNLTLEGLEISGSDGQKVYSYVEVNQLLEQEQQRAQEMEQLLQQYRERFGDL